MKRLFCVALLVGAGPLLAEPSVERGAYLVRGPMGCGSCHTPMGPDGFVEGMELAGRFVEETPAFTASAPNVTPGGAVAGWSDAELARAIREGLRPDGSLIGPPMPYQAYRHISDDDLASVVMFLRSVPAIENEVPRSVHVAPLPPAYGPPVETVAARAPGPTAEWGEYVAQVAHCMECHSPMGPTGPLIGPETTGSGGAAFHGPWGVSVAPNITPHADGIAGYDDDELRAMIARGLHADGHAMLPPMPYPFLARMSGEDLDALIAYLRCLPPLPDAG